METSGVMLSRLQDDMLSMGAKKKEIMPDDGSSTLSWDGITSILTECPSALIALSSSLIFRLDVLTEQ